jgi:hypothetical protein
MSRPIKNSEMEKDQKADTNGFNDLRAHDSGRNLLPEQSGLPDEENDAHVESIVS